MRIGAICVCAMCCCAAVWVRPAGQGALGRAAADPRILVTRTGPLPRACSGPRGVALLVARFTQAFDLGQQRRLNRFFDYYFQRYWVNEETDSGWRSAAFTRKPALLRYFA